MPLFTLKFSRSTVIVIIICCFNFGQAQLTDLVRLEYSFIPKSDSEDQYTRLRALFNYPIKTKENCYLILGAEYNRIILNLEDNYPFDASFIEKVNVIDFNIGYTFKTNEKWRLGLSFNPRIASTLTEGLTSDDFLLNGGVFAINDRTKDNIKRPFRLILGLTCNATTGVPYPLPFVSYYSKLNDRWSFNLGVPKSNIKYHFNAHSILQTFASLDGYYAHIQNPQIINGKQAENISLSLAVAGLGYEYCFTKHLIAYLYTGYTLSLNNALRDSNRNGVFKLHDVNAFYLRTGLKFKI